MRRPPDEIPFPPELRDLRRRAFSTGDATLLVEAADAAADPYLSAILRSEAHAASGDLPSALDLLAGLWAERPDDLPVLHRLAAARRALAQRDWQPRPCAIHIVSSRGAYRDLAADLPQPGDSVIEVGCSEGLATRHLARHAALVVALDISQTMIDRARERLSAADNVRFLCADASDPTWPGAHLGVADLVFLDVAGSAPARQAMALARDYRDLYLPRALILRNMELADFLSATVYHEEAPPGEWRKLPLPHLNWPWSTTAE